jgi:hypothetical protein
MHRTLSSAYAFSASFCSGEAAAGIFNGASDAVTPVSGCAEAVRLSSSASASVNARRLKATRSWRSALSAASARLRSSFAMRSNSAIAASISSSSWARV